MDDRPPVVDGSGGRHVPRVPRVTVVIPAFENAPYIRAAVGSVLAQTYRDFELVVADHSSTDGTWEILQDLAADPRVRLVRTPSGGGAQRNWNRVTREARGELVKRACAAPPAHGGCRPACRCVTGARRRRASAR